MQRRQFLTGLCVLLGTGLMASCTPAYHHGYGDDYHRPPPPPRDRESRPDRASHSGPRPNGGGRPGGSGNKGKRPESDGDGGHRGPGREK